MSLGNALLSSLTFKDGRAPQSDFDRYQVPRMVATPETHVYIARSDALPGGVGEPDVPPVSAAIGNGIFSAVGQCVVPCQWIRLSSSQPDRQRTLAIRRFERMPGSKIRKTR
jgi:CO/xanthine dehydrogenase Mo-binding subunit